MKVLVIDDDDFVLRAAQNLYSRVFGETDTASSADEGIEKFDEGDFDLVITDFHMPGRKGDAVYDHVSPTCPCIVVTGDITSRDVVEFVARTGAQTLYKPVPVKELEEAIETELDRRAASRT